MNIQKGSLNLTTLIIIILMPMKALSAAKPITGVSCQEGFYILTPDKHIHWIRDQQKERTLVYSEGDDIYAMAECGTGVITVFENKQLQTPHYSAYYSPNCRNIGAEVGETKSIYQGEVKINHIQATPKSLKIRLANNALFSSNSCTDLAMQSE
ncbi:hypothetical protein [Pseudoalteromonas sp. 68 DY56-GL68]|uniref:hypothetical protein n=1 Tax=Pseudoalteromonas sp. 68 DY56-GL68 TaxID=2974919 RepID=UPI00352A4B41